MIRRFLDSRSLGELILAMLLALSGTISGVGQQTASIQNEQLTVTANLHEGSYAIWAKGLEQPVLVGRVGAEIDHAWVRSSQYPKQHAEASTFQDDLGSGHAIKITFSGLAGKPDLICVLRLYDQHPTATLKSPSATPPGRR